MQNGVVIKLFRAKARVVALIADRGEQLMQCEFCTAVGKYYWCQNSIHLYCDRCIADAKTPLAWYWVERMRQRRAPGQFRTIAAMIATFTLVRIAISTAVFRARSGYGRGRAVQ